MSKEKSFKQGQLRVKTPDALDAYEAVEKEFPASLLQSPDYNLYNWLANFGLKGFKGKRTPATYEVLLEEKPGKQVVYWDGEKTVIVSGKALRDVSTAGRKYKSFDLDLGDPPIGWTN
jgi:hypothetical protein